nr:reverse transcriptase domain-containing protein [Tanacetum cinerariifolium]
MRTRSTTKNLFPPLDNPEITIRRRSHSDPTLMNNSKMAAEGNGDLPVLDLRTMEELCQPSLNGRGGLISPFTIQETNFGVKNDMIQQVQNSCQFHGLPALKAKMAEINKNLMRVLQVNQQVKAVTSNCETCPIVQPPLAILKTFMLQEPIKVILTILKNMQTNMTSLTNSNLELKNMFDQFMKMNTASSSGSRTLPGNTITNPKEDQKGITTRIGTAYPGPTIPTTTSSFPVVERETEETKDTVHPTNNGSTKDVQPSVVLTESPILNSEPVDSPIIGPIASTVSAPRPNQRPSIPYPSRLQDQKLHDKANDQLLLKKLPEKLGDPSKFLIPCNFPGMVECLALADLGASINIIPLSMWNKLTLPDLSPTCMTLELTDRSISYPVGVAEDVFVKVGTFHFSADFVVVDFDADPRVPLILVRSFLKTERALIDVFEGELTLHVGKKALTFNHDQTLKYSANYNDITAKRIDAVDMVYEEYSLEVLGFSDMIVSGNPTPYYDPIISTTSSTLTPFENKAFLNDDPSLPPPNQGNYLPEVCKELKICEAKSDKSSIDEPPEVEFKDLPPHLEYAFLEGDDKLPVIIAKYLSMEEKTALITVLKSHKRAIAWKLSDIKGIHPKFFTHKFLMEEDFEPAVQHQRRVNPKIHDVIKQEVLKLLDARLIYSISDSPWVGPVHCVPKKGSFTVIENEENELISTRLVTGWRVCIDYRKLNEATRKDHFPLAFMDQMLGRLAGNQYYYFLDGFSGYFQIPIDLKDQEKTTFNCPYGMFTYHRMPFGLCNTPGAFQRCMMAIFHDMIEKTMEVFMDDFSIFRNSFQSCLSYLEKMLKRCEDTNLCLNWEKSHFMVKQGLVLGYKNSKEGIEVDKAKVDIITKLPHPITVKGIQSFLGHVSFYRRFIKDFSKVARRMTHLLEKDTPFLFSKEYVESFQTLKRKLTEAPILIAPDWDMPFQLMCDACDFAIGAVLGQRQEKHFRPIYHASKTMTEAESNYTITEKEILAVVYALEKFWSYLIKNKSIVYTNHSALKYLFAKKDSKARLLCWVLLLQEFTFKVIDTKGAENLTVDHLYRLENPHQNVLDPKEINESFPLETLNLISTRGNSSTSWFADFANYHAGNFIVKGVYTAMKPLTFSRLPTMDPPGDTMAQTTQPRRFGTPRAIISDRGTHFYNDQFAKVMQKYGVTHRLATPYHPQISGTVKVSNRGLKRNLERTVVENRTSWSDKLDEALWAF